MSPDCGAPAPGGAVTIDAFVPLTGANDARPDITFNDVCAEWLINWVTVSAALPVVQAQKRTPGGTLIGATFSVLPAVATIPTVQAVSNASALSAASFLVAFAAEDLAMFAGDFGIYAQSIGCGVSPPWPAPLAPEPVTDLDGSDDQFPAVGGALTKRFAVVWHKASAASDIHRSGYVWP